MNKQDDLVSVIMPTYNNSKFIESSIQSVLNQTYKKWELIIVDDCSTDNTYDLIKNIIDERIIYIKLDINSGHPSTPRNIAIDRAQGTFIAFLDSDDMWFTEKLEKQVEFMLKNKIDFSFTSYNVISENNDKMIRTEKAPNRLNYNQLLKSCKIGCLTVVYRRDFNKEKYFIPNVGQEDYIYWLDLLKSIPYCYGMPEILANYRQSKNSVSSNKIKMARATWNIYRNHEKLNIFRCSYLFSSFVFNWVLRRINL